MTFSFPLLLFLILQKDNFYLSFNNFFSNTLVTLNHSWDDLVLKIIIKSLMLMLVHLNQNALKSLWGAVLLGGGEWLVSNHTDECH